MPSLRCLSLLIFDTKELIHVGWVVQPELHSDKRFSSLNAQHVPGLGFGEKFGNGALRESKDEFSKKLKIRIKYDILAEFIVRNGNIELNQIV